MISTPTISCESQLYVQLLLATITTLSSSSIDLMPTSFMTGLDHESLGNASRSWHTLQQDLGKSLAPGNGRLRERFRSLILLLNQTGHHRQALHGHEIDCDPSALIFPAAFSHWTGKTWNDQSCVFAQSVLVRAEHSRQPRGGPGRRYAEFMEYSYQQRTIMRIPVADGHVCSHYSLIWQLPMHQMVNYNYRVIYGP